MRIFELPWLLYLLLLVFVDPVVVTSCPSGCNQLDDQTLQCENITNDDIYELYKCLNTMPNISVLDIRSRLDCDCELLYVTNHHVNKDLVVFAPTECSPVVAVACGYRVSMPKSEDAMMEIAGKMFNNRSPRLQQDLNAHILRIVRKLYKIRDPEKRLQYVNAVLMNTRDAIDKIRGLPVSTLPPILTPIPEEGVNEVVGADGRDGFVDRFEAKARYYKARRHRVKLPYLPSYQITEEKSGWDHIVPDGSTTPKAEHNAPSYAWSKDMRLKYTIFGCIIIFCMIVIVLVLIAMTRTRNKTSNKPSHGDLEIKHYSKNSSIFKKMVGSMRTEYKRRPPDEGGQKDKTNPVVISDCKIPKTNLLKTAGVAISGLTTAIPQQPGVKQKGEKQPEVPKPAGKGASPRNSGNIQTRLLYQAGLYPGMSEDSLTTLQKAIPSPGLIVEKLSEKQLDQARGTDGEAKESLDAEKSSPSLQENLASKSSEASTSGEYVEKTLFMQKFADKLGYSVTQDIMGAVKIYEPEKSKNDELSGKRVQGSESKFLEVVSTDTTMSYAERERLRLARKKKLGRHQLFTG